MQFSTRTVVLLILVSLVAGALIERQYDAKQKIEDTKKTTEKDHTETVIHEERKPDGTVITDTKKTEDSIKKEIEKHIEETVKSPIWMISAGTSLDLDRVQNYKVQVDRQILGPIWLGIYATTRKELGASVGMQF